jgi:hypothetical protein
MTAARQQAITDAGAAFAEAYAILDDPAVPVAEAARRAHTPTGPSLAELEQRIATRRAELQGRRAS